MLTETETIDRFRELLEMVLYRARPVPEHGRPDRINCYIATFDRGEIDRIIKALEEETT